MRAGNEASDKFDGYQTVAADPPWHQKGGPLKGGLGEGFVFSGKQTSRELPYPTMTLEAIKGLPIANLLAPDVHLYLGRRTNTLPAAFEVVRFGALRTQQPSSGRRT
jgi:hypothetical protein